MERTATAPVEVRISLVAGLVDVLLLRGGEAESMSISVEAMVGGRVMMGIGVGVGKWEGDA